MKSNKTKKVNIH